MDITGREAVIRYFLVGRLFQSEPAVSLALERRDGHSPQTRTAPDFPASVGHVHNGGSGDRLGPVECFFPLDRHYHRAGLLARPGVNHLGFKARIHGEALDGELHPVFTLKRLVHKFGQLRPGRRIVASAVKDAMVNKPALQALPQP